MIQRGVVGTPLPRGHRAGNNAGAADTTPHMPKLQRHQTATGSALYPSEKATGTPWRLRCTDRGVLPLLRQMIGAS